MSKKLPKKRQIEGQLNMRDFCKTRSSRDGSATPGKGPSAVLPVTYLANHEIAGK